MKCAQSIWPSYSDTGDVSTLCKYKYFSQKYADFDEKTMWLVGEAISENGVYAEIPYLFTIDSAGAEIIYVVGLTP